MHTNKCQKTLTGNDIHHNPTFYIGFMYFSGVIHIKFRFIFIYIDPLTSIIKQPPDVDGSPLLFFGEPIFEILLDGLPQANVAQFYVNVIAVIISFIAIIGGSTGTPQHCGTAGRTWTLFLFVIWKLHL